MMDGVVVVEATVSSSSSGGGSNGEHLAIPVNWETFEFIISCEG